MTSGVPKRLVEVDLPIKRISEHARREKSIRHGHISTLHIWWARRPLAACRAVLCAALWPDPADPHCPENFRQAARKRMGAWVNYNLRLSSAISSERFLALRSNPDKLNDNEELRSALLDFIADFANWDNSTVPEYLETSRALTHAAHEALGGSVGTRPLVVDSFAGGGAIPVEALRIGADAFASDLNPVPVLLNKVVLEYLPTLGSQLVREVVKRCEQVGLDAKARLSSFYPTEKEGETPLAYIWARTILSEAPTGESIAVEVPLISSMWLSKKPHRGRALRWKRDGSGRVLTAEVEVPSASGTTRKVARPQLEVFEPKSPSEVEARTVSSGAATCPVTGFTTPAKSVRRQLSERRGGAADARMLAVVTIRDEEKGRFYRIATAQDEKAALHTHEVLMEWLASGQLSGSLPLQSVPPRDSHRAVASLAVYGIRNFGDLFTSRQALALLVLLDCIRHLRLEGERQSPVAERAAKVLASLMLSKLADYCSSLSSWSSPASQETVRSTFGRQTLAMVWDFAEAYPFAPSSGGWGHMLKYFAKAMEQLVASDLSSGTSAKCDAASSPLPSNIASCFFTDPPYYDSIPYAELSDFFYVWLRQALRDVEPEIFESESTPKEAQAIVWHPQSEDEKHRYEQKMAAALAEGRRVTAPSGIGIVVFAHKSTRGWEAHLQSMISAGWVVTASWPIDTERAGRTNANNTASLASSVHLVCRPRENSDGSVGSNEVGDWRDILHELPIRMHNWMPKLAKEGVVGADAIFACIGPALEIFSRYSRVEKASGQVVTLREYLEQVWAAVAKEALAMVFRGADTSGFEEDARLTAMWLWTLSSGKSDEASIADDDTDEEQETSPTTKQYMLEYDAARKIAQGLGANLDSLSSLVEVKGEIARLLPVAERTRKLFGKDEAETPKASKKRAKPQMELGFVSELEQAEEAGGWGAKGAPALGSTVLDRVHQSMILFAAGRSEALRRFLVDEGAGKDERLWRLAQVLSYLYPKASDEKRWIDGVLARKKGLGF
ncbi:MAG: adenine-specific methylase [Candidatus Sulfotelmatobacter sp.]|nr:adenine-specific methylase [Candidatus Sulfotelmatobacter sp.]